MSYYKADTVREAANGNWLFILAALAPHLEPALRKPGRHVSCPIHGGKDGFRLFKDAHLTGGGVCNTCGANHDGFELLMWLNNWDFKRHCCKVSDEAAFCLIQRPYISKTLLTRRISPRGSP
ncbi:hypothetical protein HCX21_20465 [Escherichia coli]|nr:hypothetical protein [Escherichia coli]